MLRIFTIWYLCHYYSLKSHTQWPNHYNRLMVLYLCFWLNKIRVICQLQKVEKHWIKVARYSKMIQSRWTPLFEQTSNIVLSLCNNTLFNLNYKKAEVEFFVSQSFFAKVQSSNYRMFAPLIVIHTHILICIELFYAQQSL